MRVFSLSGLPEREKSEWVDGPWDQEERRPSRSEDQREPTHRADGNERRSARKRALRPADKRRPGLGGDERGLASVEYVIVLSAVTLGAALLVAAMGPQFIRSFEWQVAVLGLPVP